MGFQDPHNEPDVQYIPVTALRELLPSFWPVVCAQAHVYTHAYTNTHKIKLLKGLFYFFSLVSFCSLCCNQGFATLTNIG